MKSDVWFADSVEELESRLRNSLTESFSPTLAMVFASVAHDLKELGSRFGEHGIDVFGASSAGEIMNDEVREDSISVLLLEIDRGAYRLNMFDGEGRSSKQLGSSIAEWGKTIFSNPAIMLVAARFLADGEQIVEGTIHAMGRQIPLFGGFAGNNLLSQETFVFDSSRVLSDGACVLVFDQDLIELNGVAASGWKGIGTTKTVTKSRGNLVYEIDNEPAVDIYKKYLDLDDNPLVGAEYPLLVTRKDGSCVFRGAMAINEDRSIAYGGAIHEGAKVRFSMPPGIEIMDQSIKLISEVVRHAAGPDVIVVFSCAARHLALGPLVEEEHSAIRELWGAPMAGLFTFGEIGPHPDGRCDFHNTAFVPVLIRAKSGTEGRRR